MGGNLQSNNLDTIIVCTFYHFTRIDDCAGLQQRLLDLLQANDVKGTMLVAPEGINGTIAGSRPAIDSIQTCLRQDNIFQGIEFKESTASDAPFLRTRVKLRQEIVTLGVPDIDPRRAAGIRVKPAHWNALISDPEVTVIDTRNEYEVRIGTFAGAINPNTETFREFPAYAGTHLDPRTHKKVAMFCTGGIRCEKSTAYLKSMGFEKVYHLEGGILKYLEEIPGEESLWRGECFVFDDRVTVNHRLEPGAFDQCRACRTPISDDDKNEPAYLRGVSCPYCIDKKSAADRERYHERERQIRLASERGEDHIGEHAGETQLRRGEKKKRLREARRLADRS